MLLVKVFFFGSIRIALFECVSHGFHKKSPNDSVLWANLHALNSSISSPFLECMIDPVGTTLWIIGRGVAAFLRSAISI